MNFFTTRTWQEKNIKSPFAKRLIELRKLKGFSQEELSEKLGLAKATYGTYENCIYLPSSETIAKMADFYNVSADYLLGRENTNNDPQIKRRESIKKELKAISLEYETAIKEAQNKYFKQIKEILKEVL